MKTSGDLSVFVVFGCSALYIPDPRDFAKEGQTKIVRVVQGMSGLRCGQATPDGCSLAFCTSPAWLVCVLSKLI